ncbi:MAG: hypothetical protein A2Z15_00430 [Chloroflexi bacterium RBG_16_50_11]|nr:MAG: hypothetical protein A2Z15_00430 [Chloroflexi bacterium RBG_16_50_11]
MPKSKHGRGKHPHNKKRGQIRPMQAGTGVPQQATSSMTSAAAPASVAPTATPPAQKKSIASAALPLHYEFIGSELKRIGILTGIIIVILIILYIFLK